MNQMKRQTLLCILVTTSIVVTGCIKTYQLPLFGKIEPKDLCGYPKKCRAGGADQFFTNFDKPNDKPLLFDGEVKNYLGKMVDVKNPQDQIACINPEKIEYVRAEHIQLMIPFTKNETAVFERQLLTNLTNFMYPLLQKAGLYEQNVKSKLDMVLQKSNEYLITKTRGVEYQQWMLKMNSIDAIRSEEKCRLIALANEKQGRSYQTLSNLVVMTTDPSWKEDFAGQMVALLKVEWEKDWDTLLTANGENEISLRQKIEQALLKESSQVFSFAYLSIL